MTDSQKIKKLQNKLWSAADKLWSNSELKPSEYTMPVLGLIFFKHASVKFDQTKQELEEKSSFGRRSIGKEDYQAQGVLYLPEKAHYSYLVNLKESEELISEYNNGSIGLDKLIDGLTELAQNLQAEESRAVTESLSEEDLAIFDLLTKPTIELHQEERNRVKQVAQKLINRLKDEALSLDWKKKQQERAKVKHIIEVELDQLPTVYDKELYDVKCGNVFFHVYDAYGNTGESVYVN